MIQYMLRRLLLVIPVLLGVTFVTFVLSHLIPGNPARAYAGKFATKEQVEAARRYLGLDKPVPLQYVHYLGRLVQGDLGTSIQSRQPVAQEMLYFFPATVELAAGALFLVIVVGIPLGVLAGTVRSRLLGGLLNFISVAGAGIPVFWGGIIGQLMFFSRLGILPLTGRLSAEKFSVPPSVTHMYTIDALLAGRWAVFVDAVKHLVLPAFCLALPRIASVARLTRASMVEVMRELYIRTARAKGLREHFVVVRHALKNALIPVTTTVTMQLGWLLGGTILIENVFGWGGLGTYSWVGIWRSDIPVVMGISLFVTLVFIMMNLLADVLYAYLDPRISYD